MEDDFGGGVGKGRLVAKVQAKALPLFFYYNFCYTDDKFDF